MKHRKLRRNKGREKTRAARNIARIVTDKQTSAAYIRVDPIKYLPKALRIDRIVRKQQLLNPVRSENYPLELLRGESFLVKFEATLPFEGYRASPT